MRIAIASDSATELTQALKSELESRGHELIAYGPLTIGEAARDWPLVAADVAWAVSEGRAEEGIVCCWSGTGVSIAANKIPGIRAALTHDAETARCARVYNHANVLALSLRSTTIPIMREILDMWFATPVVSGEAQSEWNIEQVARVATLESPIL
jgi:ribose 5-phosphate isomerase B